MPTDAQVCVVDDDMAIRESLQMLLTQVGYRTKTFKSGTEFLSQCTRENCDCVIVDVRMPDMSGLELQYQLNLRGLWLRCVFLSGHGNVSTAVEAMKQGAVTYLEKPCDSRQLLAAVNQGLAELEQRQDRSQAALRFELVKQQSTVDELAVLQEIIRGFSNRQIATNLDISVRTVQFRLARLIKNSGVRTRGELLDLVWAAAGPEGGA